MHPPGTDEAAFFEAQFKLHYVYLSTVAYFIVQDDDAARDIVQDFFLYCWHKRDIIRIHRDFKSYAARSVRNASINYLKKSGKTRVQEMGVLERLAKYFSADEQELEEQRNRVLWNAIEKLPEQRRKIFMMSNYHDMKYKDIAEALGISINTVKTQIRLSLQFLRNECKWLVGPAVLMFIYLRLIPFFTSLFTIML